MSKNKAKYNFSVLVVEDDNSSLTFIETMVKRYTKDVITAVNGADGLEKYLLYNPELVISDIGMPIMNGIEMSEQIKAVNDNVHIILTTAFDNKNLLLKAIDIGIFEYIIKPVSKESLERSIERAAKRIALDQEIQSQQQSISTLFRAVESTTNLVKILSVNGIIQYINPKFNLVFDQDDTAEIIGKNISELVPDQISAKEFEQFLRAIKEGKEWKGELLRNKNEHEKVWLHNSLSPIFDDAGKLTHFVLVSEDITMQKHRESELAKATEALESKVRQRTAELEKAKIAAESANKAKSMFLAKVSHELRTPMNGVLGMLSVLLQNEKDPQSKKSLAVVKKSADSLLTIINDILDISKIEAGKFRIDSYEFKPREIVQNVMTIIKSTADAKKIELKVFFDNTIPEILIGDGNRLGQIIYNIVGNAVKFTDKGWVQFNIDGKRISDDEIIISFKVKDTGIGIDEESKNTIFDSFSQSEATLTRKYGGTGLGLTITHEIVEQMKGKISFESQVGKGSTFYCSVKMKFSDALYKSNSGDKPEYEKSFDKLKSKMTVLIAEDSKINQELIIQILKNKNCEFKVTNNGAELVDAFKEQQYDLLLVDVQMPIMNGFEAVNAIREIESFKSDKTPVIYVTAHASDDCIKECFENYADEVLTKPFERENFFKIAYNYHPDNRISFVNEKVIRLDLTNLIKSINKKKMVLDKIIYHFQSTFHEDMKKAYDNYEKKDFAAIKFFAHKLKSEISNFGSEEVVKLCRQIGTEINNNQIEELENTLIKLELELNKINDYFNTHTVDALIKKFGS